ncbi:MAG: hypothetical protein ACM31P_07955 [Actinomycetota bacterium]
MSDNERETRGMLAKYDAGWHQPMAGNPGFDDRRQGHGTSGPRPQANGFRSFAEFTSSADRRQQSFSAFRQDDKGSQFAFGSKTLGKDGSIKQGFGVMASQDEHGSHFKMESFGKNHKFSLDISSGGHSGFAMGMQQGKGGFSMSLGLQGAKGPSGPGLALQSGKNGLSMMIDLRGGHGGGKSSGGGMNMSLQMGGKGGLGMSLQMGGGGSSVNVGKGGLSIGIGMGASSGSKKSAK